MAIPEAHSQVNADPAGGIPGRPPPSILVGTGAGDAFALPSSAFIADGHFVRVGGDLRISDAGGHEVVVQGYFTGDTSPDLLSPDGAQRLTPELVDSFLTPLTPGQYAQAGLSATTAPIGQVLDLNGDAFAVRADGTRVPLTKGDPVFEGDVVETGGGHSAIRMVFTDKTEFSLGNDARLALDQLVFNPDTQSGSAQFSVLKGVFIFASGQIAKSDNTDMTVTTPVATIGIRGTEVAGRVADGDSQFTIIDGVIEVTTRAGSVTLDDRGETTHVAGNDLPPSDPVILTSAQFGLAYGAVAGMVSGYFNGFQPDAPGSGPGGDVSPPQPGDHAPDAPPRGTGDRTDSGMESGDIMLASTLPSDSSVVMGASDPMSLAGAFAYTPELSGDIAAASLFSVSTAGSPDSPMVGAGVLPVGTVESSGAGSGVSAGGTGSSTTEESVVTANPAPGFGDSITFAGSADGGQASSPSGFVLGPSGDVASTGIVADGGGVIGPVQASFSPLIGVSENAVAASSGTADDNTSAGSSLDLPSTGSSGSPFRSEAGASDPFAGNPYIAHPFGYAGPQLGDPVFALVSGDVPDTDASIAFGDSFFAFEAGSRTTDAKDPDPIVLEGAADITLIVSNGARGDDNDNLSQSYKLPDGGPNSSLSISGAEMGLPGVDDDAQITLLRDKDGNVDLTLTSAGGPIMNVRAESDTAAAIRVDNFFKADVYAGNGGGSDITIVGAKRGFVLTGDGNDRITIDTGTNSAAGSRSFDLHTGAGDDIVVFDSGSDGLSALRFDGGAGIDTLRLTGPGQSFDLSNGQEQLVGVERIDISGTGGNATLTVASTLFDGVATSVNPLTGTVQTLVVDGDAGDTLDLKGNDWHQVDTAAIEGYTLYQHDQPDGSGMLVAANNNLHVV